MIRSPALDKQTCLDIWAMLSAGMEGKEVARIVDVSCSTVCRVNVVFQAVRDGTEDSLAPSARRSTNIIGYARELFPPAPPVQTKEATPAEVGSDMMKDIYKVLCGISYGITRMNEKLDKLCEAWEVNENE